MKLKLFYKNKTSSLFFFMGCGLDLILLVTGTISLISKNWNNAVLSLVLFVLILLTLIKQKKDKDKIKEQTVEVDSYEEIK